MTKRCTGLGAIRRSALAVMGLLAAGTVSLSAAEPAAAEPETSPASRQCILNSGGVTAAMQDCMADEYRRFDRALGIAYRDALRRASGTSARSQLRDAQRAWLKDRWTVCSKEVEQSGMAGGSGGVLIEDSCRIRVVSERTLWLRRHPQNANR